MRVGQGRRPHLARGARLVCVRQTTTANTHMREVAKASIAGRRLGHFLSSQTLGACTICMATCGSGAAIGMGTTLEGKPSIRPDHHSPNRAFFGADPGLTNPSAADRRLATGLRPMPSTTSSASAWCWSWIDVLGHWALSRLLVSPDRGNGLEPANGVQHFHCQSSRIVGVVMGSCRRD